MKYATAPRAMAAYREPNSGTPTPATVTGVWQTTISLSGNPPISKVTLHPLG